MAKKKTTKAEAKRKADPKKAPAKAPAGRASIAVDKKENPLGAKSGKKGPPARESVAPSVSKGAGSKLGAASAAKTPPAPLAKDERSSMRAATAKKLRVGAREAVAVPQPAKPAAPKAPVRKLPSAELSRIRAMLALKKQAISNHMQNELTELEKPEKRHRADLEEIASDTHDTDSLCEIMDIEATQMDQIDMALTKIDNGTYGICEDCGEEIPLPRLEALPFASQCINCKRRAELRGQIAASDAAASGS